MTPQEIDKLSARHVNALRTRPTVGAVVWGARTASDDPEWKNVPVRRFVLFLERRIEQGLQWVVFEPNDEPLWAAVRLMVNNFLVDLWRRGALAGTKPDEGYFVRRDRSTRIQAEIDAGRLVVLVGVAPISPTEFIIIRFEARTALTPSSNRRSPVRHRAGSQASLKSIAAIQAIANVRHTGRQ
jgi:uncharacterized protein